VQGVCICDKGWNGPKCSVSGIPLSPLSSPLFCSISYYFSDIASVVEFNLTSPQITLTSTSQDQTSYVVTFDTIREITADNIQKNKYKKTEKRKRDDEDEEEGEGERVRKKRMRFSFSVTDITIIQLNSHALQYNLTQQLENGNSIAMYSALFEMANINVSQKIKILFFNFMRSWVDFVENAKKNQKTHETSSPLFMPRLA
jgi:hypothetical protein